MDLESSRGVLIVDDEGFGELMGMWLGVEGIPVQVCGCGEDAVEIIDKTKASGGEIDLLTDLNMGDVDGIIVASYFRDRYPLTQYPNTHAVLMTASRDTDIPEGLFDARINKPFDPKKMVETIRELRGYSF